MSSDVAVPAEEQLRFPVGRFRPPRDVTPEDRARWIADIADMPKRLREAVSALGDGGLDTPYRPGGWTVRQVIHHVPDSHMNAYTRFRLALTEDAPTIKPYDEAAWATLPDVAATPVEVSLALTDALHARWTVLLRAMTPADYARTFVHPEHGRALSLDTALAMYAWHSRHHVGHVRSVAKG